MSTTSPWAVAADILDPPMDGVAQYHDNPVGFVEDCFIWEPGKEPTGYQLDVLSMIVVHKRVSVRGPHGLGKTAEAAWVVLWFALTRDAMNEDWKVPTTASVWRQLKEFLWPEIHKWSRQLDWERIKRNPFREGDELLDMAIKLRTGSAFAVASDDPAKMEGAHADQLLYIYDEAKTIPADTYDATEGAFSGAGADTDVEAFALASSTPGEPQGRFYDIQKRKPGTEDWTVRTVSKEEVVAAGRMSLEWADQRKAQWGESSAVFQNRVLGEFASSEEDVVIPLSWVEAANERWYETAIDKWALDNIGCDIADSGKDKTVLALRYGTVLGELRRYPKEGTMETTGFIVAALKGTDAYATVDGIGVGSGPVNRLREMGIPCEAFIASRRSEMTDTSEEFGFVNVRSASWWNMRELLDPESPFEPIALPPDDLLTGDLTAPHWKMMSGAKVKVESKDEIIKRLGRSPDDGDACVMAFWPGEPEEVSMVVEESMPVQIGADI